MEVRGQHHAPAVLPLKKPAPFEQDAGWAPERLWTFWRRKSFLLLLRFKHWIVWPIAQSLHKLCHPSPSNYKFYMAISTNGLLKWITFHLKLYSYSTMLAVYHRITVTYGEKIDSKQYKHARFLRQ